MPFLQPGHYLILSFKKRPVFFAIGDLQDKGAPILGPKMEILVPLAGQRFCRDHEIVSIESDLADLLTGQVGRLSNRRGHKGDWG